MARFKKALLISSIGVLMGLLHQGFLYAGLVSVPAGMMSILLQSQVIIVTLIGWLFLKETIGWRTWAGIGLVYAVLCFLSAGLIYQDHGLGFCTGCYRRSLLPLPILS